MNNLKLLKLLLLVCLKLGFISKGNFSIWFAKCIIIISPGTVPIIRCPKGNAAEMVAEVSYACVFVHILFDV